MFYMKVTVSLSFSLLHACMHRNICTHAHAHTHAHTHTYTHTHIHRAVVISESPYHRQL